MKFFLTFFILLSAVSISGPIEPAHAASVENLTSFYLSLSKPGKDFCDNTANICHCTIKKWGGRTDSALFNSPYTLDLCNKYDVIFSHPYSDDVPELRPARLRVNLENDICQIDNILVSRGAAFLTNLVPIFGGTAEEYTRPSEYVDFDGSCAIKQAKILDGCRCKVTDVVYNFDQIVDNDGKVYKTGYADTKGMGDNLSQLISAFISNKNRCPRIEDEDFNVIPGTDVPFFNTDSNITRVPFSCREVFKQPTCCCKIVESGALTKIKECQATGLFEGATCESALDPGSQYEKQPIPQKGDCSVYSGATGKDYTATSTGFAIDIKKLREQAKTLDLLKASSITALLGRGVSALMAFIGAIALALYLYAGLLWMTAAGNAERIEQAKKVFIWTSFGLTVMFSSYLIVNFIFRGLQV